MLVKNKIPNVGMLELASYNILSYILRMDRYKSRCNSSSIEFNIDMFSQVWGSTCCGIDESSDGSPFMGGSAMTKEYTVVFNEVNTGFILVFFGERLAYVISKQNMNFIKDLSGKNLYGLHEAKYRYVVDDGDIIVGLEKITRHFGLF